MRVTRRGQVTIPIELRRALGIHAGSEVEFELDGDGARMRLALNHVVRDIARMRGAGDGWQSTDEILALTRR